MRRSNGNSIRVGLNDNQESSYQIVNCVLSDRNSDGELTSVLVDAELVINHRTLRSLVAKAYGNRSKRSRIGPVTVRVF